MKMKDKLYLSGLLLFCLMQIVTAQGLDNEQGFKLERADDYFLMDEDVAFSMLDEEVISNPYSVEALIKRAKLKMRYGQASEAKKDLDRALQINPFALYLYDFYGKKGIIALLETEPNKALVSLTVEDRVDEYRDYLDNMFDKERFSGGSFEFFMSILNLIELEEYQEAVDQTNAYLTNYPDSNYAMDLKAFALIELGEIQTAKAELLKALSYNIENAMTYYKLGRIARIEGDEETALDYFNRSISINSAMGKAYFERAKVHKSLGQYLMAVRDYSKAMEKSDFTKSPSLINRGLTSKMLGDFNRAHSDLSKSIRLYPSNALLYKNRGNISFLMGELEEALRDYDKAISLNEDLAEAYYNRSLVHYKLQNKDLSCEDLARSAALGITKAATKKQILCDPIDTGIRVTNKQ